MVQISNENEIAKMEHDNTYHVKKVSQYTLDNNGNMIRVNVQNPIPTDGDSVYSKDINQDMGTTIGSFTGTINSLFDDYDTEITDSTATNPKTFTVRFERPITASSIGIGSGTGNFSNVKILLKDLSGVVRVTIDDSTNSTKYTSNLYPFAPNAFIEMVVEFHTADAVKLNGMLIKKDVNTVSRLQALKPDGTVTNIDATNGGNLKVSLEEFESGVSTNSNTQLKTTIYDEGGIPASVDDSTNTLQVINYEHHEIHSGSHYFIDDVVDLAINSVFDMQFTTPNTTKWIHMTFTLGTEAETDWYIYEDVTINTPGIAYDCYNNNRNSANTCGPTITTIQNTSVANANADTAVVGAIQLRHGTIGAGRTNSGTESRSNEVILKQNTAYCFRVVASAAGYVNFDLNWYEHTNKN